MTPFRGLSAVQVYICKNGKYMQPTISEALGNCHCLNGDFQFRAPTRNPVYAACTVCYLGCFLDSASERGMTVTDSLADNRKFQVYMFYIPYT